MKRSALCYAAAWLLLPAAAAAAEPPQAKAERESIARERAAVEQRYLQAEGVCRQRFAVSACVEALKAERREALAVLRAREIELDDAARRAAADEHRRRHDAKRSEAQAQPAPKPDKAQRGVSPLAGDGAASAAAAERVKRRSKTADDAAAAAARVAAQQRRASEAAAHREEVDKRNAERAARGKKAAPLPVPAGASGDSAGAAAPGPANPAQAVSAAGAAMAASPDSPAKAANPAGAASR